jgi:hypothetical protein
VESYRLLIVADKREHISDAAFQKEFDDYLKNTKQSLPGAIAIIRKSHNIYLIMRGARPLSFEEQWKPNKDYVASKSAYLVLLRFRYHMKNNVEILSYDNFTFDQTGITPKGRCLLSNDLEVEISK